MANTNGVMWHIDGQVLDSQITKTGSGFMDVWVVTYTIDSGPAAGTEGTVKVNALQYNAEVVKAAIEAQIKHVHNVASL